MRWRRNTDASEREFLRAAQTGDRDAAVKLYRARARRLGAREVMFVEGEQTETPWGPATIIPMGLNEIELTSSEQQGFVPHWREINDHHRGGFHPNQWSTARTLASRMRDYGGVHYEEWRVARSRVAGSLQLSRDESGRWVVDMLDVAPFNPDSHGDRDEERNVTKAVERRLRAEGPEVASRWAERNLSRLEEAEAAVVNNGIIMGELDLAAAESRLERARRDVALRESELGTLAAREASLGL